MFNDYRSSRMLSMSQAMSAEMNPSYEEMVAGHPYGSLVVSYLRTYINSALVNGLAMELSEEEKRILTIILQERFLNNEIYCKSLIERIAVYALASKFGRVLLHVDEGEALSLIEQNLPYEYIAKETAILHGFAYNDMRNASISSDCKDSRGR